MGHIWPADNRLATPNLSESKNKMKTNRKKHSALNDIRAKKNHLIESKIVTV